MCHVPHHPARSDPRPGSITLPASASCGHSRCSAASVRAQHGNQNLVAQQQPASEQRWRNHSAVSSHSKGDLQGCSERGPAVVAHGRMPRVKRSPDATSAAASLLRTRLASAKCNGKNPKVRPESVKKSCQKVLHRIFVGSGQEEQNQQRQQLAENGEIRR